MHKVVCFLLFTVFVVAAICLVRTEGAFWELMAKELHSQCLRMDAVACLGFKIQRATGKGFITNKTDDAAVLDKQVDKVLVHNIINNLNFSNGQTGREIKEKFRTLDSIIDVIAEVATSSFKHYISSKDSHGGSGKKMVFLPLLLGIVLKAIGLIPLILGKLAVIGSVAFFVSKLSLAIVGIMSLKKLFQSLTFMGYPAAGIYYYGHPYYYQTHPHEHYQHSVPNYDYSPQHYERGHQDNLGYHYNYQPQAHYGYTNSYSPETYQGHIVDTGRHQGDLVNSYQHITPSAEHPQQAVVYNEGAANGVYAHQGIPSFYTSVRRRRRGIHKLSGLVSLHKKVRVA